MTRALRALGARKIVIATPYLDSINQLERSYFEQNGFDVLRIEGLQLEKDSEMVRVSPACIARLAESVDQPDADAIFASCGALRSIDVVEQIERRTGKPVVTSNQAMAWDVMRLCGVEDCIDEYGSLLRLCAAPGDS